MIPPYLLEVKDEDGDKLIMREVGGFGEPMLVLGVVQDDDFSGINLNSERARKLYQVLQEFLAKYAEQAT